MQGNEKTAWKALHLSISENRYPFVTLAYLFHPAAEGVLSAVQAPVLPEQDLHPSAAHGRNLGDVSETDERTVNTHINRLRDRFSDCKDFEIVTVRGLGYKAVKKVD